MLEVVKYLLLIMTIALVWVALSGVCAMTILGSDRMKKDVAITAHRGGAGYGPENSISCIRRSLEVGTPSIEIDVQLSKDGYLIVCHDHTVDRTTNGAGRISDLTLSELQSFRLVSKEGRILEEGLPRLADVLKLIDGKAHLLLEIKCPNEVDYKVLNSMVVKELNMCKDVENWVTVQSFSDETLENMHEQMPTMRLEKLAFFKILGLPCIFDGRFKHFNIERYCHVESFNFFYGGISQSFVNTLHEAGKRVRVWTLNKPDRRPNLPIDGIITDYPDLMMSCYNAESITSRE